MSVVSTGDFFGGCGATVAALFLRLGRRPARWSTRPLARLHGCRRPHWSWSLAKTRHQWPLAKTSDISTVHLLIWGHCEFLEYTSFEVWSCAFSGRSQLNPTSWPWKKGWSIGFCGISHDFMIHGPIRALVVSSPNMGCPMGVGDPTTRTLGRTSGKLGAR